MELIFERSVPGRRCDLLPPCDVPEVLPSRQRKAAPRLPEVSENDISRHYTRLAAATHGVNNGCYPLGSCTMKYNPKINEEMAALPGFTGVHPLQPEETFQGSLELLYTAQKVFCEITGMDAMTFQPAAGAHGEFTGLLLIKAYHESRGDEARKKIIVPDSAHGTNPASAVMAGFTVVNIPSTPDGLVDLTKLREAVGPDTAGLMLTNPNTVGLFDPNILEITKIVHDAGGLCYYDGANLNAVMGVARPGDMGFDVVHLNLHKTFSTPHGGGGPGSGPAGCKAFLAPFLPGETVEKTEAGYRWHKPEQSIGQVRAFHGNFLVVVKALTYALTLGAQGILDASRGAVLNANYLRVKLSKAYKMAFDHTCMHEFVMSLEPEKEDIHVTAMDVAKALLDYGIHPPTMYFPLIVHEALMVEPTETESKESLDRLIAAFLEIHEKAGEDPDYIRSSPHTTRVSRLDEVGAARNPVLHYQFPEEAHG
jgi:glycine dehydrogenase subunit 2